MAIKFLLPHMSQNEVAKKRFIHEAQAASALDHPNICTIYQIGETEDGHLFIAMAFYGGETLKDKIESGPVAFDEAVDIANQIAQGLEKAHAKDIVHRDIKPANISITEDGQVKIVDFGLAKLAGRSMLTKEGSTLGTVAYMSPEQTRGPNVDLRTDIWALGVILYEMLTGECPFKGDYPQAVIYSIMNEEPEPLRKINADVPTELEEVVFQALIKKPADRYQSAKELREDLEAVTQGLKPLKAAPVRSIKMAVLPFANLTGDIEQEYLSDGFTQEIISKLGRLHPENLCVIARSSVMRYKNANTPIDQIGRELKVDYVLEGTTRREAEKLRVSADLIQVRDQTQIWGDTYERQFADILALQSDVAQNVAKALSLKLLPAEEQARLASVRQVNTEAYEAYLKGMSYAYKLNPQDIDVAMQYFESSLEKDPDFALAHTGVANVWCLRQVMGSLPPSETTPLFRAAAKRALDLDSTLAEVQYVWAFVKWFDWDWKGAEEAFKRAIEINPNYPDARVQYSQLLAILKRPEEAIVQAQQAVELDPFNPVIMGLYGSTLSLVGRYDEGMTMAYKELRVSPNSSLGLQILWWGHHYKGEYDQAFEGAKAFYTAMDLAPIVQVMEQGYETGGYFEAMRCAADAMAFAAKEHYIQPYWLAILYAVAGEREKCLDWLEEGYETKDPIHAYMTEIELRNLIQDEPRYQDLLRKMNLPVEE